MSDKQSVISNPSQEVVYEIQVVDLGRKRVRITRKTHLPEGTYRAALPIWRPGRYALQDYSKYVFELDVQSGHGHASYKKLNKNTWEIKHSGGELSISFDFSARQHDAGGTFIADGLLYFNPINFSLFIEEDQHLSIRASVAGADQLKYAGSLNDEDSLLTAKNYAHWIDSPFVFADQVQQLSYTLSDADFFIHVVGMRMSDTTQLIADFEAFSQAQAQAMGGFPFDQYHFIVITYPFPFYHGVEHDCSTIITLGPRSDFGSEKMRDHLLGVSSHELFHAWNVCRLKPKAFANANYFQELYFEEGFVMEGFTTYFGDYYLQQSGVFDTQWWLDCIAQWMNSVSMHDIAGRLSMKDSSVDLWVDGYDNQLWGRSVSIYTYGALAVTALDLSLCMATKGSVSAATIFSRLWNEHKKDGYTNEDIYRIIAREGTEALAQQFQTWIASGHPFIPQLVELLRAVGVQVNEKPAADGLAYGIGLQENAQGQLHISHLISECGLHYGDVILSVDGKTEAKAIRSLFSDYKSVAVELVRMGESLQVSLEPTERPIISKYSLQMPNVKAAQNDVFQKWISGL
ncbi:MAG: hypothetical protein LAT68_11885 [Cyclobacteriaceae bacterium]|nr:hypothetical protein [Cyclobacteriaceae bacterium]MCH8517016.1 hypothetical protein [Cyclobacteriaceae bacterium]